MPERDHDRAVERRHMVDEIIAIADAATGSHQSVELDPDVLTVMRQVPRHAFIPGIRRHAAYRDCPLDIGDGQTISQPFMVALMTSLLRLEPGDRILEIGTGCGYQTAILAELAAEVFSIEIVEDLAERAASTLKRMGHDNVHLRIGDGHAGWPEAAPFDAVIITAAPDKVPEILMEQLKVGGRLVVPVGTDAQELKVLTKAMDNSVSEHDVMPVRFVPFVRDAGGA